MPKCDFKKVNLLYIFRIPFPKNACGRLPAFASIFNTSIVRFIRFDILYGSVENCFHSHPFLTTMLFLKDNVLNFGLQEVMTFQNVSSVEVSSLGEEFIRLFSDDFRDDY